MAIERLGNDLSNPETRVTNTTFASDLPPSSTPIVSYCGVSFGSDVISGASGDGLPAVIARSEITGLAMHAVVSRGRAITHILGSIVLLGIAGALGLSAIGAIHLLGHSFLGSQGIHLAIIIQLLATAWRQLSTAWDPRHILVVTTIGKPVSLLLKPTPEPFQLIKTLEEVQQTLGYVVDPYPEQNSANVQSTSV
jgi:hypothetical protein